LFIREALVSVFDNLSKNAELVYCFLGLDGVFSAVPYPYTALDEAVAYVSVLDILSKKSELVIFFPDNGVLGGVSSTNPFLEAVANVSE